MKWFCFVNVLPANTEEDVRSISVYHYHPAVREV